MAAIDKAAFYSIIKLNKTFFGVLMKRYLVVDGSVSKDTIRLRPAIRIGDVKPGEKFYLNFDVSSDWSSPGFIMLEKHRDMERPFNQLLYYIADDNTYRLYCTDDMEIKVHLLYKDGTP